MSSPAASIITFAVAVAAAAICAVIISSTAHAHGITTGEAFPKPDTAVMGAEDGSLSDALKRDYVTCERAATGAAVDAAMPALCASLYEELRVQVFGGDSDALLTWFRGAWDGRAARR